METRLTTAIIAVLCWCCVDGHPLATPSHETLTPRFMHHPHSIPSTDSSSASSFSTVPTSLSLISSPSPPSSLVQAPGLLSVSSSTVPSSPISSLPLSLVNLAQTTTSSSDPVPLSSPNPGHGEYTVPTFMQNSSSVPPPVFSSSLVPSSRAASLSKPTLQPVPSSSLSVEKTSSPVVPTSTPRYEEHDTIITDAITTTDHSDATTLPSASSVSSARFMPMLNSSTVPPSATSISPPRGSSFDNFTELEQTESSDYDLLTTSPFLPPADPSTASYTILPTSPSTPLTTAVASQTSPKTTSLAEPEHHEKDVPHFILELLASLSFVNNDHTAIPTQPASSSASSFNVTLPVAMGCVPPSPAMVLTLSPHGSKLQYAVALTHVPTLHQLTVCLRFQVLSLDAPHFPLSYASQNQDNAVQVFLSPSSRRGLGLYINNVRMKAKATLTPSTWHAACMTWSSVQGRYHIFLDGNKVKSGKGKCGRCVVPGDGVAVLGAEQDHPGGGFNPRQVTDAHLTHLNLWPTALPEDQLSLLSSCHQASRHTQKQQQNPLYPGPAPRWP